jgi:integrase
MSQNGEKVHGPYRHYNKYRVVLTRPDGSQQAMSFSTEAAARAHKTALLKEIAGRTVSDAVQAHVVGMRERGLRRSTYLRAEDHLRAFFQLDGKVDGKSMPYAKTGGLLDDLRPRECEHLYSALTKTCAVDTHRNALVAAKTFGAWCVKQEWIATNPVANVEPIGQRNRGKKQLRIDEARKLVDVCIRRANEGHEGAVGALASFLLGLRASEVTDRVVRDLDDNGRLLWIEFGKTKRSRRTLEVPALLRPYLLSLAKDRPADAQLISRTVSERSGKKRDRYWLLRHVERLCAEAEVPVVCTQSLRGLHASVATDAGATSHVVASALGHSSPAVTHAHYIDSATARRARTRRVVGTVVPEQTLHVVGAEPSSAGEGGSAPRKRTRQAGAGDGAAPVLRTVRGTPAVADAAGAGQPAASGERGR